MIDSSWTYISLLLLCAGLMPFLEHRVKWRIFNVLPSIVLTYLLVTSLSVLGFWHVNQEIASSQKLLLSWLLPALMFLLLVSCDFKAIVALGPRILGGFASATLSLMLAMILVYALMHRFLPADAWQSLASVSGGWIGGTANLVAVSQALQASPNALSNALLTDALCYSVWVLVLFSSVPLQARLNAKKKAVALADCIQAKQQAEPADKPPMDIGMTLLWLGLGLLAGKSANLLAAQMPETQMLTTSSWTMLLATLLGLVASYTPLRKLPGSMTMSSALLAIIVATIASQASFSGIATAPLFVLTGLLVLSIHGALMLLAARIFHFDLALCGIASLANVGGVASAPLLAAAYSPALAPVGVLLAMLGYILGTGGGLIIANILKTIGMP